MSTYSLLFVCYKDDVSQGGKYGISGLIQKGEGELLAIYGDPVGEEYCIFLHILF